MPAVQRKYVPLGLIDPDKAVKRAWSAADYAIVASACEAHRTHWWEHPTTKSTASGLIPAIDFASKLDEVNTIVVNNANPTRYGVFFGGSVEPTGTAGDIKAIAAMIVRHFQQVPTSSWARANANWIEWCGGGSVQSSADSGRANLMTSCRDHVSATRAPVTLDSAEIETPQYSHSIDWDVRIETPPVRPSRTVKMRFRRQSSRKPEFRIDPYD